MTDSWAHGYFTHLPYTFGYYREMSPAHLRFCLLARGILPPDYPGAGYCELAMGQGYSVNIHAAANAGLYLGLDFMPEHAVFASRMAREAGSGLIVFDQGLEQFQDGAAYDYICLHGGWSWISPSARKAVVDFVANHLRPGGIFYISCNCWPGWFAAAPLRKLLHFFDFFYGAPGADPKTRIANAMQLTGAMLACQPIFLNGSAWTGEHFEKLKEESPAYLAHEFFNADWHVEWFSDLAAQLERAKLTFAASARASDNIPGFGLTADAARFCDEMANVVAREQVRDFFCNTRFRQDIFVRGGLRLEEDARRELLGKQKIILALLPEDIQYVIDSGMGHYEMDRDLHAGIVNILAEDDFSPKALNSVYDSLQCGADFWQMVWAIARLLAKGYVLPCKPDRGRDRECENINEFIEARDPAGQRLGFLASPVTGAGLSRKISASKDPRAALLARAHGIASKTLQC